MTTFYLNNMKLFGKEIPGYITRRQRDLASAERPGTNRKGQKAGRVQFPAKSLSFVFLAGIEFTRKNEKQLKKIIHKEKGE